MEGPTLIRAAAKNFNDVAVISNIDDYSKLVKELENQSRLQLPLNLENLCQQKRLDLTAYYDSVLSRLV